MKFLDGGTSLYRPLLLLSFAYEKDIARRPDKLPWDHFFCNHRLRRCLLVVLQVPCLCEFAVLNFAFSHIPEKFEN